MPASRLDVLFRRLLLTRFFTKGWGSPDGLIRLFQLRKVVAIRENCLPMIPDYPKMTILRREVGSNYHMVEGKFQSPFVNVAKGLVSPEIQDAYFQLLLPFEWKSKYYKPVCIHLAGTGDHYYWRRRVVTARPLLREGIGAVLLENPYYGVRKPKDQVRSSLHNVSDIFVMGGCLIFECLTLLRWLEMEGFGPLGISGLSMGGHVSQKFGERRMFLDLFQMASLAATNWPKPLVLVPCLSWTTASSVFTEGVMSLAIDWDFLQQQYYSDPKYCDMLSKLCRIVDDPTKCSLCKGPEYQLSSINLGSSSYITPFDMLESLSDCIALSYKHSSQLRGTINRFSILTSAKDLLDYFITTAEEQKLRNRAAIWFMRGIMDECTHLKNFAVPFDTSLITAICAEADAYVPREGCSDLKDIWPGATVSYVDTGHVGAYLLYQHEFRKAVIQAFKKAEGLCPPPVKTSHQIERI